MATNNDVIVVEDPANTVTSVARNKVTVVLSQALNDGVDVDTGFIRYDNDAAAQTILADTWTSITNDGLGSTTTKVYSPQNVGNMLTVATGALDFSELALGDTILMTLDYTFTPSSANATMDFQVTLGSASPYSVAGPIGYARTVSQAHRNTPFVVIPLADSDTLSNPGVIQFRSDSAGSLAVNTCVIQLINRFG